MRAVWDGGVLRLMTDDRRRTKDGLALGLSSIVHRPGFATKGGSHVGHQNHARAPRRGAQGDGDAGAADAPVIEALALDERRRAALTLVEALRAERNTGSKQIGQLMREGKRAEGQALQAHMGQIGDEIKALDELLILVDPALQEAMLNIPNLPHPSVPVGKDDTENVIVRTEGTPRVFDFEPKAHWDLGPALDIIDFERGVKLSGTRFYLFEGRGRTAAARADRLDARRAHAAARLHRDLPALHGQSARRWWAPASCRSSPTTSIAIAEEDFWLDPDRRGAGDEHVRGTRSSTATRCRSTTWPTRRASAARR